MKAKTLGILGGIFDPVHHGHLAILNLARQHFGFDLCCVVPAGVPPHKESPHASAEHRLAMLKLALAPYPYAEIIDHEARAASVSYTIQTIEFVKQLYPDYLTHFIIGSDNLTEISGWYNFEKIIAQVVMCVAERPGFPIIIPPSLANADIRTFPSPQWGLSSTMLRTYLAQGISCTTLIPDSVLAYIKSNGLYEHA